MRVAHLQKINNLVINIGIDSELITTPDFYFVPIGNRNDVLPGMIYEDGDFIFKELPVVPKSVTARQARLALLGVGLLQTVNMFLENMSGIEGESARIEWEYASEIQRHSPLVDTLGPALGLTSQQIDQLFIEAEKL